MKILVVEDSKLYRTAIVKYLKKYLNYPEFITAKNGQEGLEKYNQEKPNFLIFDLLMPKLSGQELFSRIRKQDKKIKAVIISANIQNIVKEEMKSLGILKFINKPFTEKKAAELAKIIEEN